MLELRPTCEQCNKALPPASLEARICSYECTFCAACVEDVLGNVCPNCGGGFTAGSIRGFTRHSQRRSGACRPINDKRPAVTRRMLLIQTGGGPSVGHG